MKIQHKIISVFLILLLLCIPQVSCQDYTGKIYPADNNSYFECLLPKIKGAKKSIYIIMYSAKYYPNYPDSPGNTILNELINARKRGVKIEVIFNRSDQKIAPDLSKENMNTGAYLAKGGIPVYFDSEKKTTHAKLVVIDRKFVVIGSANWTYYAFTNNNEVSVIIESEKLAEHYIKYFETVKKECSLLLKPAK